MDTILTRQVLRKLDKKAFNKETQKSQKNTQKRQKNTRNKRTTRTMGHDKGSELVFVWGEPNGEIRCRVGGGGLRRTAWVWQDT